MRAAALMHADVPFIESDSEFARQERLGDLDLMGRLFVIILVGAHHELARRDRHHLGLREGWHDLHNRRLLRGLPNAHKA